MTNQQFLTAMSRSGLTAVVWCGMMLFVATGVATDHHPQKGAPPKALASSILYVDSGGAVLECDPSSRSVQVVSQGQLLVNPYALAVVSKRKLVVSDTGRAALVGVDLVTGDQAILAQGPKLGTPYGLTAKSDHEIYVANGRSIVAVNPRRGQVMTISSGNLLRAPLGICEGYGSFLFVADATGRIIQVHTQTGRQRLVSSGGNLVNPVSITYHEGHLYVTEMTGRKILLISPETGRQRVVSANRFLTTPIGIAFLDSDTLLVSDPDCNNFAGALIRIELTNGSQKCLVNGSGDFVNPRGLLTRR